MSAAVGACCGAHAACLWRKRGLDSPSPLGSCCRRCCWGCWGDVTTHAIAAVCVCVHAQDQRGQRELRRSEWLQHHCPARRDTHAVPEGRAWLAAHGLLWAAWQRDHVHDQQLPAYQRHLVSVGVGADRTHVPTGGVMRVRARRGSWPAGAAGPARTWRACSQANATDPATDPATALDPISLCHVCGTTPHTPTGPTRSPAPAATHLATPRSMPA